jgi:hypothetical protein
MHPISFFFIDWLTPAFLSMTIAWLIAARDLKLHWKDFEQWSLANWKDILQPNSFKNNDTDDPDT